MQPLNKVFPSTNRLQIFSFAIRTVSDGVLKGTKPSKYGKIKKER
jgi:hypothetical protein